MRTAARMATPSTYPVAGSSVACHVMYVQNERKRNKRKQELQQAELCVVRQMYGGDPCQKCIATQIGKQVYISVGLDSILSFWVISYCRVTRPSLSLSLSRRRGRHTQNPQRADPTNQSKQRQAQRQAQCPLPFQGKAIQYHTHCPIRALPHFTSSLTVDANGQTDDRGGH